MKFLPLNLKFYECVCVYVNRHTENQEQKNEITKISIKICVYSEIIRSNLIAFHFKNNKNEIHVITIFPG